MLSIQMRLLFESPVLVFVSGAISLSQVNEAFMVLGLSVVDKILVCRFPPSPLSSTCSYSNPDCHFQKLFPVAIVVVRVVY